MTSAYTEATIVLHAALAYAARALPVFPCRATNKAPLVAGGFKSATTDASAIKEWWRRWPKALIGIPTGVKFDVLDLDAKDGRNGFAAVPNWQQRSPLRARTRTGGAHLYFRSDGTIHCTTDQIAAGVDTRGAAKRGGPGGYVIVPPSPGYSWEKGAELVGFDLSQLPPWPADLRPPERGSKTESGSKAENNGTVNGAPMSAAVAAAAKYAGKGVPPPEPADLDKIRAALGVIPAENYQTWFAIGAALRKELGGGGFELFENWSRTSAKYDAKECAEKWKQLADVTGFGAGTIFHYADLADAGWRSRYEQAVQSGKASRSEQGKAQTKAQTKSSVDEMLNSAADLRTKTYAPLRWIVPDYLPEGLTLLAGKPKIGKSWLGLDVGVAIASGGSCLGRQCEQGDVLALMLDDKSERRLQRRLTTMLGAFTQDWPARLKYATSWPRLNVGGLDYIQEWIGAREKPRLVIIDILESVRQRVANNQRASQYSTDYEALNALQNIATEAQLSILVLHHQRKMAAEDLIDTVSGTLGLGGAVDTVLILGKDDTGKFLYGRGRDLDEFTVSVSQNEQCRWQVLGAKPEAQPSPERAHIVTALTRAGKPMTVDNIAKAVAMKRSNVKNLLSKMHYDGEVERVSTGLYKLADPQADLDLGRGDF